MKTAIVTLSNEGAAVAFRIGQAIPEARVYVHESAAELPGTIRFHSLLTLTAELFHQCRGLVYIAPCGAVVRAVAPHAQDKTADPAVVVVDVGARYAISLLSGHEGGANELALRVANLLDAEPVITTSSEARKTVIAGIGCRRGVEAERIVDAVQQALQTAGVALAEVRLLASADIKSDEPGLATAALRLGIPLRFISSQEIRGTSKAFAASDFVWEKVNLPAVAEPAALLAGRRTQLLLPKQAYNGVTVALARENCWWWESAPEGP